MLSSVDSEHLQGVLHNSRGLQASILGCEWHPLEWSNTVTLPLPCKRRPDSSRLMQGVHSHAATIMEAAGGNVHKSRALSIGDPARVKSSTSKVLKTLWFWFFLMRTGQIPAGCPWTSYTPIKMPLGQLILYSAILRYTLTLKQFLHHFLLQLRNLNRSPMFKFWPLPVPYRLLDLGKLIPWSSMKKSVKWTH